MLKLALFQSGSVGGTLTPPSSPRNTYTVLEGGQAQKEAANDENNLSSVISHDSKQSAHATRGPPPSVSVRILNALEGRDQKCTIEGPGRELFRGMPGDAQRPVTSNVQACFFSVGISRRCPSLTSEYVHCSRGR